MRVVKPGNASSLNGSPHNQMFQGKPTLANTLGRRMTVMGDTTGYRRRRLLEATAQLGQGAVNGVRNMMGLGQTPQPQTQTSLAAVQRARGQTGQEVQRPMSWCPATDSSSNFAVDYSAATQYQNEMQMMQQQQLQQQNQMNMEYSPDTQQRLQQFQRFQEMQQLQQQQLLLNQQAQQNHLQAQQQAARLAVQQQAQLYGLSNISTQDLSQSHAHPASAVQTPYMMSHPATPLNFSTYSLPSGYFDPTYIATTSSLNTCLDQEMGQGQEWMLNGQLSVPTAESGSYGSASYVSTTPPTPECLPMMDNFQTGEQNWQLENNEEDDGEVLIGMGLYDAPDVKSPKHVHEETMMQLCGPPTVPVAGKGLKLEEAYVPPAESENEEDSGEEDAEGEDEEVETEVDAGTGGVGRHQAQQTIKGGASQPQQQLTFEQANVMTMAGWV